MSSLYRFKVELADLDANRYETLDFRLARHSSETDAYLLTRALAYVLTPEPGVEVSGDLSDPEQPALRVMSRDGVMLVWIDIGTPSDKRLKKARSVARATRVYTYKQPEPCEEADVFAIEPRMLNEWSTHLARDHRCAIVHSAGELVISGDKGADGQGFSLRGTVQHISGTPRNFRDR